MIRRTLAHYPVLEQVGAGGRGEVYCAADTKLGRMTALQAGNEAEASNLSEELKVVFQREVNLVVVSAVRNPYLRQRIDQSRTLLYAV